MGAGKSTAAINMMNNSTGKKYIYITPYLDEVERIKRECFIRKFVSPEQKYTSGFSKLNHIHELMRNGKNIASTHALFGSYTQETIDLIKSQQYTLILDEVANVIEESALHKGDLELLLSSHCAKTDNDEVLWVNDDYDGTRFQDIKSKSKSHNLIIHKSSVLYWMFPIDVFNAFSDVYVLTYLFPAQIQRCYFDLYKVPFIYIGVKNSDGVYHFCDQSEGIKHIQLKNKIHILDNPKLNSVGDKRTALSSNWFKKASEENDRTKLTLLKNNLYNLYRQIYGASAEQVMWTTFAASKSAVKGKGYTNGFVSCNLRASNEYRNRTHLAYCINVFMQPWKKLFFEDKGITVDESGYALSEMIQWIWRSAIRDGKEIWIYVPSSRMRSLLIDWIEEVDNS